MDEDARVSWTLYSALAPVIVGFCPDGGDVAASMIGEIGCSVDLDRLTTVCRSMRRSLPWLEGLWVSIPRTRALLKEHPLEALAVGDWPVDEVDAHGKRLHLGYLASKRHVLYLVCRWLLGHAVPDDVRPYLLLSQVYSDCRKMCQAARWEGVLPPGASLELDA